MEPVQIATSDHGCFLCKTFDGPFLRTQVSFPDVPFPDGYVTLDTVVDVCVGNEEHPAGCVTLMAREAGGLGPFDLYALREAHDARIADLQQKLAVAVGRAEQAEATQVVPVKDVLDAVSL